LVSGYFMRHKIGFFAPAFSPPSAERKIRHARQPTSLVQAAVAGMGVCVLPSFDVAKTLREGGLERLPGLSRCAALRVFGGLTGAGAAVVCLDCWGSQATSRSFS